MKNLRNQIKKEADSFVNEHKSSFKDLNYSVESLNVVETIIEKEISELASNSNKAQKIGSYMLETLIANSQGKIIKSEDSTLFYSSRECFDVYNYVRSRILYKNSEQANYSF